MHENHIFFLCKTYKRFSVETEKRVINLREMIELVPGQKAYKNPRCLKDHNRNQNPVAL